MWGSDAQIPIRSFVFGGGVQTTPQLARVDYGRPETWSFFFYAYLQESVGGDGAGNYGVTFDLFIGSGRSTVSIPGFCTMLIPQGDAGDPRGRRFTKSVVGPVYNDTDPAPIIDDFVAQSINCTARVQCQGGLIDMSGTLVVSAFFAPRAHIRPEWFRAQGEQFRGGEDNGL